MPDLLGFVPYQIDQADAIFRQGESPTAGLCEQGLPGPPGSLRVSSDYRRAAEEYLSIGKKHVSTMRAILAQSGFAIEHGHFGGGCLAEVTFP